MDNAEIANLLDEIADLLELREANEFRVRSYRSAAQTVRDLSERLADLASSGSDLSKLPNVGESTAEKIHEILETGTCQRLEELRKQIPEELTELMRVPQLGPRKAKQLHDELGVENLEQLKAACEHQQVRGLSGMGPKTEENILAGIETLESTSGRVLLRDAVQAVESLGRHLEGVDAIERWEVAGSFRRRKETIGDLDVLVRASDRTAATEAIKQYGAIAEVMSEGTERATVRLRSGLQIDFRYFDRKNFGAALLYFTGSKEHGIALRRRAQERGWKLNEYGLHKGDRCLAAKTERAVYGRLGLSWIPPELREERGEVERAEADDLPHIVEADEIRGDLHAHTTESDGNHTLEEMVEGARERGREYLAITDHSQAVRVARGLDEERLRRHADHIREVDRVYDDIRVFAGVEVDILEDGALDLEEDALAGLDWVVGSVHFHLNQSRERMTKRMVAAISSGVVHCLGHPFERLIGERRALAFDFDKVLEACREHDVCLEINSQPDRLDLPDVYCRHAREAGVPIAIGTDAHSIYDLDFLRYGTWVARRGWLEKGDVVNTLPAEKLEDRLRRG